MSTAESSGPDEGRKKVVERRLICDIQRSQPQDYSYLIPQRLNDYVSGLYTQRILVVFFGARSQYLNTFRHR